MANKKVITVTQVTHYPEDDPKGNGDYYDIELLDAEGKVIATFGDYYHDKGQEKAEGFIQGVEYALGVKVKVVHKKAADR